MGKGRDRKTAGGGVCKREGQAYQIRLKGHLNGAWSEWLDGLTVIHDKDGTTVLAGSVADQSALYGLLVKIRDLGLPLLSVQRIGDDDREVEGR